MSSRKGYYRKTPDLRARPVYEMGYCLVFTPSRPNVYTLNSTAWLILELCDGKNWKQLESAYWSEVNGAYQEESAGASLFVAPPYPARETARRELRRGLNSLRRQGIVEFVAVG